MIDTIKLTMEEVIRKLRQLDINPNDIKGKSNFLITIKIIKVINFNFDSQELDCAISVKQPSFGTRNQVNHCTMPLSG